jgi:hypothetical protein
LQSSFHDGDENPVSEFKHRSQQNATNALRELLGICTVDPRIVASDQCGFQSMCTNPSVVIPGPPISGLPEIGI